MPTNKSSIHLIGLFVVCFLFFQPGNSAYALDANSRNTATKTDSTTTGTNSNSSDSLDSVSEDTAAENKSSDGNFQAPAIPGKKVNLIIRINVPHNIRCVDTCRIYPYPVAPPKIKNEIQALPTSTKELKSQLKGMGYTGVTKKENPFPSGGWRMQYAFKAAQTKAGLGKPHGILTMYNWIDDMLPYLQPEVVRMNAIEKLRKQRYDLAQSVFDEHNADMELQSFNQGLFPIDVSIQRQYGGGGIREGRALVNQTNWWIVAIHKVPGLKYYWLWPVKLSDLPEQVAELTEFNAIYIEGSW